MRVETYSDTPWCVRFYDSEEDDVAFLSVSLLGHEILLSFQEEARQGSVHHVRFNGECRSCRRWHRWLLDAAIAAGLDFDGPA